MYKLNRIIKFQISTHTPIAIIGAGTAGLNTSAQLIGDGFAQPKDIRIFEPKKKHCYQPGWTMVGGGIYDIEKTMKPNREVLHNQINITDSEVVKIMPEQNSLITQDNQEFTYDQLVIASGILLDFSQIKGATQYLNDPDQPVGCIYHPKYTVKMNKMVEEFEGGRLLFTEPQMPIKCGGAPQKIMYLTHDRLQKRNIKSEFHIHKTIPVMFAVPKYSEILNNLCDKKGITRHFKSKLIEVQDHKAIFQNQDTKELSTVEFDLLHLVPPQIAPAFIKESGLSDAAGFVDVNPNTLQHKKYQNIWALGDCSSLPTSKTAAAVMAQTPILVQNLVKLWKFKEEPKLKYQGYTSCPIFTSQSTLLLAEFKYDNQLDESFPIFQSSDSRLMFHLKKDFFPFAYWKFMVKGQWGGRDGFRFFKGA